jgi:hypothetical protein
MLALWLPILLSAVFVFVLSALIHMALPWHKNDFKKLPDEDKIRDALRPFDVPPGDYMVPMCDGKDMNSPETKAKLDAGPNLIATVLPKGCSGMGLTFVQWLVYLLAIGFFTAYVAHHTVAPGAHYRTVFRIVGAVAFLAHAGALWPQSIWFRRSWGTTLRSTIDGLA